MKLLFSAFAVAAGLCAIADTPVATSADCAYALDTEGGWPCAIKTAADLAAIHSAVYRAGDSLVTTAPDGTMTTTAKVANTAEALPINAGGLWTFANPRQKGTVSFTVRHSIYGSLGDGTLASPAKLVDADELSDLVGAGTASDGYCFMLKGLDSQLFDLSVPSEFGLAEVADGIWRLDASAEGCRYASAAVNYPIDSKQSGPRRVTSMQDVLPVAYSGDNWRRDVSKAATLTFISPSGAETAIARTGTGTEAFTFDALGVWTVRLTMADGNMQEAAINIIKKLFTVSFR